MKKLALICIVPAFIYAHTLQELLDGALSNNEIVSSKKLLQEAGQKQLEASQNSYFPTVDVGSSYQSLNQKSPNAPGDVYNGFVKIGLDIYDGGYKSSDIAKNKALLEASKFETSAYEKSLQLEIVQDFYNIKNTQSTIKALEEKSLQLEAELERIKKFYEVGSATKDEIDKLQAAFSNNIYTIETSKYQLETLKQALSIKIAGEIQTLEDATITPPVTTATEEVSDEIKALMANVDSYEHMASSIESSYNPKFRLENTYNVYDYDRTDATHPEGLDNQNKFLLTFSMRLYDNAVVKNQKEATLLQKRALQKQVEQSKKLQNTNIKLSLMKIQTAKSQIISAKESLESANSAYETILEKYKVGAVDNVAYLDALSTKTDAKSQYEKAQNDLQVAYATYYYYTNQNIKEYIQ
jgi:outer membrane protein TolC